MPSRSCLGRRTLIGKSRLCAKRDVFSSSVSLSRLELSDTNVYASQIRALLGTASHFCKEVALQRAVHQHEASRAVAQSASLPAVRKRPSCEKEPFTALWGRAVHSLGKSRSSRGRVVLGGEEPLIQGKSRLCRVIESLWEGCRESRRCSRDTYPESYITEYLGMRRDPLVLSARVIYTWCCQQEPPIPADWPGAASRKVKSYSWFMVEALEVMDTGVGCRVWGVGGKVQGLGCRVSGLG